MALSSLRLLLLTFFTLLIYAATTSNSLAGAQIDHTSFLQLTAETLEWPSSTTMSVDHGELSILEGGTSGTDRRSLYYWRSPSPTPTRRYYISYGALSANRIPCPARSGRSYYTHNCYRASGPVHPYTRGCSTITRCRR